MIKRIFKKILKVTGISKYLIKHSAGKEILSINDNLIKESLNILEVHRHNACSSCIYDNNVIMNENYDLQIIIPAYNVEKYIAQCLDSILNSNSIEKEGFTYCITVVNDGSTDNTYEILQKYQGDKRINIINQDNKGSAAARNTALKAIIGKYIMFVDSDDKVDMNAVALLLKKLVVENIDIVQGSYKIVSSRRLRKRNSYKKEVAFNGFAWGKIYRNKVFERIIFPEGNIYEDSIVKQIIDRVGYSVSCNPCCLYFYRSNPEGITQSNARKYKAIDSLYITLQLHNDGKQMGLPIDDDYYKYILDMLKLTYNRTKFLDETIKKAIFIISCDFIVKNFENCKTKENAYYKKIEAAMFKCDYGLYKTICEWY